MPRFLISYTWYKKGSTEDLQAARDLDFPLWREPKVYFCFLLVTANTQLHLGEVTSGLAGQSVGFLWSLSCTILKPAPPFKLVRPWAFIFFFKHTASMWSVAADEVYRHRANGEDHAASQAQQPQLAPHLKVIPIIRWKHRKTNKQTWCKETNVL